MPKVMDGSATPLELQELGGILAKKPAYSGSNADIINGKIIKDSLINTENEATPSFYGGADINYSPFKKLNINTSIYFYGKQTFLQERIDFLSNDNYYTIDPKVLVNLKVSYKFWKNNSLFINGRNVFNNEKREFAFMDKVGGLYLIGLNLNF